MKSDKQKMARYEMHKYWGKKPAPGVLPLVDRYSKEGDLILDPFAGYGVFCSEAYLNNRNVIINDLNPVANFIESNLFEDKIDFKYIDTCWSKIKLDFVPYIEKWFKMNIDGKEVIITSILRTSVDDKPIKVKYKSGNKGVEVELTENQIKDFIIFEQEAIIDDWYPSESLIINSRISAHAGMTIADLFTKRTLACHARLLSLIDKTMKSGVEKNLMLEAFTANLANCSKLVPPIKSRGDMSQGAWMTGFYIGETYIENNVLPYFENRLRKVINGKKDFYNSKNMFVKSSYKITNMDAKHLSEIPDETIDYIFTDPPYGDTVPYFEQSIIWNSWLKLTPNYENEIVISDSKERKKKKEDFSDDIYKAFKEISRVLKEGKHFSLTYHSLSGTEWAAITNACLLNRFELTDYQWLTQKSFTPRQINRSKTVKGDVLVTLKKNSNVKNPLFFSNNELEKIIINKLSDFIGCCKPDTNELFLKMMKWIFENRIAITGGLDIYTILKDNFIVDKLGQWTIS